MRFAIRQEVEVSPAQAVAAYASPAFYEGRPPRHDIAVVGVVGHEEQEDRVVLEVRLAFRGPLSSAVRKVVAPEKLSWVTRTEIRPAAARAQWEVVPDHYPDRLSAHGAYLFAPGDQGPESTVVNVEGELGVHVPIVGRSVERAIVSGLRRYLEDEVASIRDFLR